MDTKIKSKTKGSISIHRSFEILNLLNKNINGIWLTDIASELDIPKSTVHRIIKTLGDHNMIREPEAGFYKLGYGVLALSNAFIESFDFLVEIKPALHQLNQDVDETVHLGVLTETKKSVVYLYKLDSSKVVRMVSKIGQIAPIHCTALGKSLISALSDVTLEKILLDYEFVKKTSNTICSAEELREEIKNIRKVGYSMDRQEHEKHVFCVASNVVNKKNEVLAAISISAPVERMTGQQFSRCVTHLKKTTNKLSVQFAEIQHDELF